MRHLVLLVGLLLIACPVFGIKVTLKDSHSIQKEFLTLSDFFEGVPDDRDQEILEAPTEGNSRHYPHAWVRRLAQNFGLYWSPLHYKGITLTRHSILSAKVNPRDMIKTYLSKHYAEKLSEGTDVVLDYANQYFSNALDDQAKLTNFTWLDEKRFIVTFDVKGREKKVKGGLSQLVHIPVLNKPFAAGHVIQAEDITYQPLPSHRVTARVVQDQKELIGKALKRPASKVGTLLYMQDLVNPIIIKRGDLVTMRVETPNVIITARGKANGSAAVGQTIQVMNLDSKRLIEGVVKDAQTVIIPVASR